MKLRISLAGRTLPGSSVPNELDLPGGACIDDALAALRARLAADQQLSPAWLVVVSGEHLGTIGRHKARLLRDGEELLLIAPVAGG